MLLAAPVFGQEIEALVACAPISEAAAAGTWTGGLLLAPCRAPSLPPSFVMPFQSDSSPAAADAAEPLTADLHLASTELGFDKGVGPAPGRSVRYLGHKYRVIDIEVQGGGPSFSGGSAFVVGLAGSSLIVGLKAIEPGSALDPDRADPSVVN
ncbi:hypothetical protein [Enhydrobacter aerosaccus]|nr:hypothetical protein [Enhydrobacter aerosaccus]